MEGKLTTEHGGENEVLQQAENKSRFLDRMTGGQDLYQSLFEIGLFTTKEGGMAVSAVWRLVHFLAPYPSELKEQTAAHRRDACAPLQKSKRYRLLVLQED